jgi:hypothetical protein
LCNWMVSLAVFLAGASNDLACWQAHWRLVPHFHFCCNWPRAFSSQSLHHASCAPLEGPPYYQWCATQ